MFLVEEPPSREPFPQHHPDGVEIRPRIVRPAEIERLGRRPADGLRALDDRNGARPEHRDVAPLPFAMRRNDCTTTTSCGSRTATCVCWARAPSSRTTRFAAPPDGACAPSIDPQTLPH